ncbi:MAG: hypothetical protein F4Y03_02600 [Alphaproteobacteria bacterium]|nr:hypothetical protein [Alphaproteobacteria bacterium]
MTKRPTLTERLAAEQQEKEDWKARADQLAAELDAISGTWRRHVPGWIRWVAFGVLVLFAVIGLVMGWNAAFGTEGEAAKHGEELHQQLMRFIVALAVTWGATAASLIMLTLGLDFLSVRREFLALVKSGKASCTSMALFTVGTALYAGLIFVATLDALSLH